MKYLLPFILLLTLSYISVSQTVTEFKWNNLLEGNISKSLGHQYFMIQADYYKRLAKKYDKVKIIKKLDSEFYVVKDENNFFSTSLVEKNKVWPINNEWKISSNLALLNNKRKSTFILKSSCNIIQKVSNNKYPIEKLSNNLFKVQASLNEIRNEYLNDDCIVYIGKESTNPVGEANVRDLNFTFNGINQIHRERPEINGSGITVSIKENQYDLDDIDLLGKDIPSGINSSISDEHATEMATIIGGRGNTYITGRGVANEVNLSSSDFFDIVPDSDEEYSSLGINLQNHSYGTIVENFYGVLAESYDISSYNNPNILHIFSSGNQGLSNGIGGIYNGLPLTANITGNFKMSKNTLSIGSVDTVGNVIPFSSRGPAYDGRIKPELVAYSFVGTSNSAAMVTGLCALLEQAYVTKYNTVPSSALIKSLLITGAKDVGSKGIDFVTGFGSIQGNRTLNNLENDQFILGEVTDQGSISYQLDIPMNATNLKVTLVWTDPASAPTNDAIALVNDLDMTITNGTDTWLPWTLNTDREQLRDEPTRGQDHLNNIEQISVSSLLPGIYTINISGFEVSNDKQAFAISYQWDESDTFEWNYPSQNDNLPYDGEVIPYLQWKNTYSPGTLGKLEYTIDDGHTWNIINDGVDLSLGSLRWDEYPNIISSSQLRMTVNDQEFLSDQFVISKPLDVSIGFDCGDSLLFFWNNAENAKSFNLYSLVGDNLELINTTSDTSMLIQKDEFSGTFFALEPVLENNQVGLRSFAIDILSQQFSCYISSFFPIGLPNENKVELFMNLSSNFNIESIKFERSNGGEFIEIGEMNANDLEFTYDDLNPSQGINIYRSIVQLKGGQRITSEESEVYFLTSTPFLLFPNPAERPESISVFTKNFEGAPVIIEVFNTQGELILSKELLSDRDRIATAQFLEGLYFYRIRSREYSQTGRIIIN